MISSCWEVWLAEDQGIGNILIIFVGGLSGPEFVPGSENE